MTMDDEEVTTSGNEGDRSPDSGPESWLAEQARLVLIEGI
jgi:hypothetical protein